MSVALVKKDVKPYLAPGRMQEGDYTYELILNNAAYLDSVLVVTAQYIFSCGAFQIYYLYK